MFCGPKGAAKSLTRIGFGLTLLFMGIANYLKMDSFMSLMSEGFTGTPLEFLGPVMTYILPALMILGGFLFTIGVFMTIGTWAAGLSVILFPVLMMLKAVVSPDIEPTSVMPFVVYGIAWIVLFKMVAKGHCGCGPKACGGACGGACATGTCPGCGHMPCDCGKKDMDAPVKAAAAAPTKVWSPAKAAPVKSAPAKKPVAKKAPAKGGEAM
jgi:hypothetical protein